MWGMEVIALERPAFVRRLAVGLALIQLLSGCGTHEAAGRDAATPVQDAEQGTATLPRYQLVKIHLFNRFSNVDKTFEAGSATELLRSALQRAQWLEEPDLMEFPLVMQGEPVITLTYANGETVIIRRAYRCSNRATGKCQAEAGSLMVNGYPVLSNELVDFLSTGNLADLNRALK